MPVIVTMQDLSKQIHNKEIQAISERLDKINHIIKDAHWEEANDVTSHVFTFRTALAKGTWRLFNKGTPVTSGKTAQGRAYMGMYEDRVRVDKDLVNIAPNPDRFFSNEVYAHSEGASQFLAEAIIYGNHDINAAAFHGLAPQMDSLAMANVYGAGGVTSNAMTSLYGIEWGPGKVYMVYPKGAKHPMEISSKQEGIAYDDDGNEYDVVRVTIKFKCALVVEDPRYLFRVCNLDPTKMGVETAGYFNENLLIKALNKSKNGGTGIKLYGNEDLQTLVDVRAKDKASFFKPMDFGGEDITAFKRRPMRRCESILSTEAVVA